MRIRREKWGAMAVAACLVLGVGCGLSLGTDEEPPFDAGSDTNKPPVDGQPPDVPTDGALPDGSPPVNEEAIDDDASFLPSNLDAAAAVYSLEAGTVLTGVTELVVSSLSATVTTSDGGSPIPAENVHFDADCNCMVVSVKDWAVPFGTVVNVVGDVPLVVVANGDVTIDGTVRVALAPDEKTSFDGPAGFGNGSGGGGGGGATAGGAGGPGSGAANPRTDGGPPHPPGKLPWTGANGGNAYGTETTCGRGGVGGGGLQVYARVLRVGATGRLTAVGGGAEAGCGTFGGGGGGSGGTVFLEGRLVRIAGTVLATGGGGAGGGGSGAAARSSAGNAGDVTGGAGGDGRDGGGKGGQGGDDTLPTDGGSGARGGGGGGAAGLTFVRGLNVRTDAGKIVPRP
jgi:hypothetical protein